MQPSEIEGLDFFEYEYTIQNLKIMLDEKRKAEGGEGQGPSSPKPPPTPKMPNFPKPKMPNYPKLR